MEKLSKVFFLVKLSGSTLYTHQYQSPPIIVMYMCTIISIFLLYFVYLDYAGYGNFTCRNDSSIELPLAYLCEGTFEDGGYRRKRDVGGYGHFFIDCPDGSDESPDTCGENILILLSEDGPLADL